MSSAVARSSKYSYRASSTGVGAANDVNVNIEYSADLSALSRLEVRFSRKNVETKLKEKIQFTKWRKRKCEKSGKLVNFVT